MRVGVLGGTFDPVHLGHLHVADRTRRLFGFSEVHFVVASSAPHKPKHALIPFNHRYAMVTLATAGHGQFLPSMIELESPASPFSIDTLGKLARRAPGRELYFIAGGDSLLDVVNWRRSEELLGSYNFVFVTRPGSGSLAEIDPAGALPAGARARLLDLRGLSRGSLRSRIRPGRRRRGPLVYLLDVAALDVSSSQVRKLAAAGKRISHLVPPPVREYIQKLEVYGER